VVHCHYCCCIHIFAFDHDVFLQCASFVKNITDKDF
jgi:hypothetical protein